VRFQPGGFIFNPVRSFARENCRVVNITSTSGEPGAKSKCELIGSWKFYVLATQPLYVLMAFY